MEKIKKITALLLSLALLLPLLPATAWATETEEIPVEVVETADPEEETTEEDALVEEASAEEEVAEEEIAAEEEAPGEVAAEEPAAGEETVDEADESGIMTAATEYTSGNWTYTVSSNKATVTGYTGSSTSITIPSTLGGYTVTEIGALAFLNSNITSVTIPDSVEVIGLGAFQNCYSLTSAALGNGIKTIELGAFYNCAITSITIPSGTASIGSEAFYNCTKLTKITINAKSLDNCSDSGSTFYNAGADSSSLTVVFGSSVKKIPAYLFYVNRDYDYGTGEYAHVTSVTIPNSVEEIGMKAFENCYDLTSVSWSSSLTTIGARAFKNCSITSVTIPSGTTSLGYRAFYNCTKLTKITINAKTMEDLGASYTSGEEVFYNVGADSSSLPVIFGSTVKKIPAYMFYVSEDYNYGEGEYAHITSVTIPTSVEEIGDGAFKNCYDLKDVYYAGSASEWAAISIGISNECLTNATIHYSSSTLSAPTMASITNTTSGVKITWNAVSGATSYNVYRKASGSTSWSKVGSSTSTSYTSTGVTSGVTYTFTVQAVKGSSSSSYGSSTKTIRYLSTPSVTLSNITGGVKVSWTKSTGATGGYYVYRRTESGSYTRIAKVASGTLTYTDKAASAGVQYYYAVRAYSNGYYSSYTSKTIIRLGHPTLTLTRASTGVKLTWTKSSNCTGYYIYRKSGTGSYTRIKTVTGSGTLTWTDTTAKKGVTYTYAVRAYKGSSQSSYTGKSISY